MCDEDESSTVFDDRQLAKKSDDKPETYMAYEQRHEPSPCVRHDGVRRVMGIVLLPVPSKPISRTHDLKPNVW